MLAVMLCGDFMKLLNLKRPFLMVVLINLLGFGVLALYSGAFDKNVLYLGVTVTVILGVSYLGICKMSVCDVYIFLIVSMLFSIGEVMLYRLDSMYGERQFIWLCVSLIGFFAVYIFVLKTDILAKLHYTYFAIAIILFLVTLIFGTVSGGAKNWIIIKGFSIQPSEIIKLLIIFTMADRYTYPEKYRYKNLNEDVVLSILVYTVLGFLVLQREWGTAVLIFLVHISMMYIYSGKFKVMFANVAMATVGGALGVKFVSHIQQRIDVWLDPWTDIAGKGYQITQSLFAIGAGGFFGTGIGLGSPEYIPKVHSDFIFSAICEEFGVLGGVAVIMLYFMLVYRGIRIAMQIENIFYKCIASGISIMFGFQSFIILGGVTKFIPLTGITLPFISYGGSSLAISFFAIAVIEAAANKLAAPVKEANKFEEE